VLKSLYGAWFDLAIDSWRLAADSQTVIAMRMMKLAAGDAAAAAEAQRMVSEKIIAAGEVQGRIFAEALTGQAHLSPQRTLTHYRRKVAANRRRLARG
jgi:hypothetical protein